MVDINRQVGKRIRALREGKGFSLEGLAEESGLHRSHMGEIERGEINVSLATLQKIGVALHLPLSEMLRDVR